MRRSASVVLMCLWASLASADGIVIDRSCVDETDRSIPQEFLDKARRLDLIFGHQSVGGNVLDGLSALAEKDGKRYAVERVEDPAAEWFDDHEGWGDFFAGENENPASKCEAFRSKMVDDGLGKHVAVASVKLCWIDFAGKKGEAEKIFAGYRDTMEILEKAFPKVKFIWWTAPLKTEDNPTRAAYNRLVRDHCRAKGKILFDIADIESRTAAAPEPKSPVLLAEYAEDEGHLNETGRLRAARAWWWLMARLAGWDGKPAGK